MMNKLKLVLILFVGMITFIQDVGATHIIGGNMSYRYIGNNNYEISLTFRRDCFTGDPDADFDDPARVYFYKENNALASVGIGLAGILNMNFNPDDTLGNTFVSDCGFEGQQVCVQETEYKDTIRLPFLAGGYTVAYQRCCRNPEILNILEPLNTGTTWWIHISEEALIANNSNPRFKEWPAVYICAGEPIAFDHSATDQDGDSLVYRLYTPHTGGSASAPIPNINDTKPPYETVSWRGPIYSQENMLGGAVPLAINSETGLLEGIPPVPGQFLIGVLVDEYRDGVLISTTRRDFQYNVRICSDPPKADFTANDGNCNGTTVEFQNLTVSATEFAWNFNFPTTDPAFFSNEENPVFTYPTAGVYDVQLMVTRGTDQCRSDTIISISAVDTDIEVDFSLNIQACQDDGDFTILLTDQSVEPLVGFDIIDRQWTITQNGNSQVLSGSNIIIDVEAADFVVDLQVTSGTGCSKSLTDTIALEDLVAVTDFTTTLANCPDGTTASIVLTDISDGLNPFDSPTGRTWTVVTASGTLTSTDNPYTLEVDDSDVISVTLLTNFGGGCNASESKEINLEDLVPQAVYDFEAEGCPDDGSVDVTFSSSTAAANPDYPIASTTWSVTAAGTTQTSTQTDITFNLPKDSLVTVVLTVVFENGCIDVITDQVVPGPFATIEFTRGNPFLICLGDTVQLVDDPNPAFTYTWSTNDGLVFDGEWAIHNPGLVGIANTTYFVTVTDGLCTVEDSVMVEVLDGENLAIVGDSITCDGSLSLTASGGILDGEFIWSLDPSFADTIAVGPSIGTNFTGASETYYVAFTGISCNDPFAEFTVSLSEVFSVAFNGDPVRVCVGDTAALLANYNPDLTYEWSPQTNLVFFNGNTSEAFFAGLENGTYNVTITDDFCSTDTSVNVEISDIQELTITGDSVICDELVKLSVSGAIGNGNYEWSTSEDFAVVLSTADTLEVMIDGLSQTYFVRFTDPTCGNEVFSYSVRLYEFNLEYVNEWVICPGDTVGFPMFNLGEQDLTFTWTEDIHIVNGTDTLMSPTIGTGSMETDTFTIYFTAESIHGCVFSDSIPVRFRENPSVSISSELQECGEFTVCFSIDGDFIGFPGWNFGDPTTEEDVSINPMPCWTYPSAGIFEVTLNNLVSICPFESDTILVTVNDGIDINPIAEQIACLGDTVRLSATSPDFNVDLSWCNAAGDTLAVGSDVVLVADSSYTVTVKGVDVNGCEGQTTVDITLVEFDVEDNIGAVFCDGQETFIELTVNGETEGYSFEWSPTDCIVSGGNTANPIILASGEKTLSVLITNDDTGCSTERSYPITVTSFVIAAEADPDTINPGESTDIFVLDQMSDYEYEWSNGNTNSEQTVTLEESSTFTVTVTDELGCTATTSVFIFVRTPKCDETDVYIPNAFTPNDDNVNDVLYVRSNFIDELQLIIYNRWGEEVFQTTDPSAGWDGRLNGDRLSPDVYAYYMDVLCINGVRYSKKGNVSLLK